MDIKTFDDLRRKIGSLIGVSVPPKGAEAAILERDTQGVISNKTLIRMFIALYQYLENNAERKDAPTSETV